MCRISTRIKKVSKTNLFIAPNADKTRQITIYSNLVHNASTNNAMVLPVPLPHTIQFIDLSAYKDLFKNCAKCFEPKVMRSEDSFGMKRCKGKSTKKLEVFNVGSYTISLATNLAELTDDVDESVFKLSDGLKADLTELYAAEPNWGFIICKLNTGLNDYHPFAYSHDIYDKTVFIPTQHYHEMDTDDDFSINGSSSVAIDNTNLSYSQFLRNKTAGLNVVKQQPKKNNNTVADDWSHAIYLLNLYPTATMQRMNSCREIWNQKMVDFTKIPNFEFGPVQNFEKISIHGTHDNIDLTIPYL
jgi:hypothetical protein